MAGIRQGRGARHKVSGGLRARQGVQQLPFGRAAQDVQLPGLLQQRPNLFAPAQRSTHHPPGRHQLRPVSQGRHTGGQAHQAIIRRQKKVVRLRRQRGDMAAPRRMGKARALPQHQPLSVEGAPSITPRPIAVEKPLAGVQRQQHGAVGFAGQREKFVIPGRRGRQAVVRVVQRLALRRLGQSQVALGLRQPQHGTGKVAAPYGATQAYGAGRGACCCKRAPDAG